MCGISDGESEVITAEAIKAKLNARQTVFEAVLASHLCRKTPHIKKRPVLREM